MSVFDLVGTFAVRGIEEAEADIRSATRTAERSFDDMGSSAKKAADDVEKIGRESTDAGEDVEDFGKKSKKAGEDAEEGFKKADIAFMSLAGNLGADTISDGLGFISDGVTQLIEVAEESQEDFGKLSVAFDKAGYSAEAASGVYYDFVGLLGETDQAVEASNHLAKLCKNEEELSQWTNIAAGVFAEFGDSLPLEGLTEAANETAKVGQVTGPLADALNWAGIAEDEFNQKLAACSTEAERSALITQALTEVYGESGQAYRETNAELVAHRESQAKANETAAEAGNALLPLATMFTDIGSALLEKATPGLQQFSDFMTGTAMPAVQEFGDFVDETVLPALERWAPLLIGVATFFGVLTVAMNLNNIANALLTAGYTLTSGALTAAATAQTLLNSAMLKNPITWIVALIAALVAAFIYLWNTSEEFRAFWIGLWESIKEAAGAVIDAIVKFFTEDIPATFEKAAQFFEWLGGVIGSVFSSIGEAMTSAGDWAKSKWEAVTSFFSGVPGKISGFFSNVGSRIGGFFSSAASTVRGHFDSLVSFVQSIPSKIIGFFSGIGSRISSAFGSIRFPTPHVSWNSYSVLGKSFSIPTIKFYASGGIVTDPTLGMIGEAGYDEAVVPLEPGKLKPFAKAVVSELGGSYNPSGGVTKEDMREAFTEALGTIVDLLQVNLVVNGRQLATATAGDVDSVSGNRQMLVGRGLTV